jgi:hypothetical protein
MQMDAYMQELERQSKRMTETFQAKYPDLLGNTPVYVGPGWEFILDALFRQIESFYTHKLECRAANILINNALASNTVDSLPRALQARAHGVPLPLPFSEQPPQRPRITCVKEKYAALTIYMNCDIDPAYASMVGLARTLSRNVCEDCGNKGEVQDVGRLMVVCERHLQDALERRACRRLANQPSSNVECSKDR